MGQEGLRNLIAVKRADVWAHSDAMAQLPLEPFDQMERMLEQILERGDCCSLKELALSGKDLIGIRLQGPPNRRNFTAIIAAGAVRASAQ